MSKDNGGSAFPQPVEIAGRGMSLRDYFAAAALTGYRALNDAAPEKVAKWSYEDADAMLKARGE